ncbi:MAG: hypothetical protein K0T99_04020 [Alphaproteobacteria bacterium]|nr:hypothetical protein [Alphaproteobacteria bacterium]
MKHSDVNLYDKSRSRNIPVAVYLPKNTETKLPVVIFSHGYQKQIDMVDGQLEYKKYTYLAEYFTNKGYAFISIQHDIPGDTDGIENIDPDLPKVDARKHLWIRGEENIFFVINELTKQIPEINFNNFIISGHSNGGDISKYFANNNTEMVTHVISFDGRRCPLGENKNLKLLMFEAIDTSTDVGVIPDEGTQEQPKRFNLEWVTIKPKNAMHMSYSDVAITDEIKNAIYKGLDFFL